MSTQLTYNELIGMKVWDDDVLNDPSYKRNKTHVSLHTDYLNRDEFDAYCESMSGKVVPTTMEALGLR